MPNDEQTISETDVLSHVMIHTRWENSNNGVHDGTWDRATEAVNLVKQLYALHRTPVAVKEKQE